MIPAQRARELMAELDDRLRKEGQGHQQQLTRFPFNGLLSPDEQRMADQHAFDEITP